MSELRIVSLNVRGLGEQFKCRKIFHYLHQKETDIVMLQETHSTKRHERFWNSQWGGKIYFSHGQLNARGVCIMFQKNLQIKITDVSRDQEGRILMVKVVFNEQNFMVVNVYAPNDDDLLFIRKSQPKGGTYYNNGWRF